MKLLVESIAQRHSRLNSRQWLIGIVGVLSLIVILSLSGCGQQSDSGQAQDAAAAGEQRATPESEALTAADTDEPVATTEYGKVRGFVEDDVLVFKGIRYGADAGAARFAAPRDPEPWEGVKDAVAYGTSARQIPTSSGGGLFDSWKPEPEPPYGEDCLFLNVWTPALRDGAKRPVMVWFHGGGFSSGSGSSQAYDGVRLANGGDVVVVTVNHRLNVFGYLYLGEYGEQFADSGMAGMLDLVQSLEWVRDNIEEFGGDPENVLIFGESGGGAKVSMLMAMDAARGLFDRAVIQSGPLLSTTEKEAAAKSTRALVEKLGLTPETIDQIRTMPAEQIETAARELAASGDVDATWNRPALDGINLTRQPFVPDAAPQSEQVPLLIGTTRTENSLLIGARDPAMFDLTWESLPEVLAPYAEGKEVEEIIARYRSIDPELTAPELFFTATTDAGFLNRSVELADKKAQQGGAPVYMYLLNWDTPVDEGKWLSPHALEIGMVFDNVAKSESMSGIGDEQQQIADMMSKAWLAFARSGDPNHAGIPQWPAYTAEERATMVFDTPPAVVNDPRGEQRQLFLGE